MLAGQHLKWNEEKTAIDGFGELLLLCFMPMSISFRIDAWHFWCCYCETTGSYYSRVYDDTKCTLHIVMTGSSCFLLVVFFLLVYSLYSKVHWAHFFCINYLILLSILFFCCLFVDVLSASPSTSSLSAYIVHHSMSMRPILYYANCKPKWINYTENGPRIVRVFWVSLHTSIGLSNQICTTEFNLLIHFMPALI